MIEYRISHRPPLNMSKTHDINSQIYNSLGNSSNGNRSAKQERYTSYYMKSHEKSLMN